MTGRAVPAALAALAVAAQIAYPLVAGTARDDVTVVVVLALAAAALAHAWTVRGARWTIALLAVTAGLGLASELVGTATGFPFGCYDYAVGRLGPAVAGVPLVVPLAWTAGSYPVWCAVTHLVGRDRPGPRIALTAVGIVGWDLFLDPQMVVDGQWRWCSPHTGLPGLGEIPWTNYVGWLLVAIAMAAALASVDARLAVREPTVADDAVPLALFLWTWLGSALAHAVFLGPQLRWSAVYGLVGMGVVGVPLLGRLLRRAGPRARDTPSRRAADPTA
ncbi:carotenoid biosynthesis protein [Rhodococcus spelaei]|uniref:Carotenoid biosynthesis protein n=1 Tax=Rhodococcus spelaei TaxID=2546320 RepID=A0A541BMM8_9NOCA|nr:carotenoid biosynthesis protein [Rhodococcus spelaei]TQF73587.1 carotenoid biosynthesis protein [Rhodococcus spelaei]